MEKKLKRNKKRNRTPHIHLILEIRRKGKKNTKNQCGGSDSGEIEPRTKTLYWKLEEKRKRTRKINVGAQIPEKLNPAHRLNIGN